MSGAPPEREQTHAAEETGAARGLPRPESIVELAAGIKPRLRGWLHAGVSPLVLAAGVVLIVMAPDAPTRVAVLVYAACALTLFASSGIYHRGRWSAPAAARLRRLDHANIYLMIAGTNTPVAYLGLPTTEARIMLIVVWSGAALGVAFRVGWIEAPRALYTVLYIGLGWSVIAVIGPLFATGGTAVGVLTLVGGICYTLGAVVYAARWPDPSPGWFGFHEVFHSFTIAAWVSQYVAISLLLYRR